MNINVSYMNGAVRKGSVSYEYKMLFHRLV